MTPDENLKINKIKLPRAIDPIGSYNACKRIGNLLFISGQISIDEKNNLIKGKLGEDLSIDDGYEAAKRCALLLISQAKKFCDGDLNKIKSCVKLTGYVNSSSIFIDQPKVINGASDLIFLVFGENGKHARAAISSNSLPLGVAVEVDAVFEMN